MKIVDRKTFLAMPAGTLYSKYEPCIFEDFCIKGDTLFRHQAEPIDWFYQQLIDAVACKGSDDFAEILLRAQESGESFGMDFYCEDRDGCFEDEQLFAVWEAKDVQALIARLQAICPPDGDNTR